MGWRALGSSTCVIVTGTSCTETAHGCVSMVNGVAPHPVADSSPKVAQRHIVSCMGATISSTGTMVTQRSWLQRDHRCITTVTAAIRWTSTSQWWCVGTVCGTDCDQPVVGYGLVLEILRVDIICNPERYGFIFLLISMYKLF